MIGQIVSLAIVCILLILVILFFIRKKTPVLAILFSLSLLGLAGMKVLAWFLEDTFNFAADLLLLVCIVGSVATIVVYQNDFKNLFLRLSQFHKKAPIVEITDEEIRNSVNSIVTACQTMAKSRTGALIVIVKDKIDQYILDSGIRLDAVVSAPLLESIFNPRCPMHDGAVIIKDNKILTAGSFLPLSKSDSISKDLGTRHRAGIGVTEAEGSDIISIIISEENGIISTATNGVLRRYLTPERLYDLLYDPYKITLGSGKRKKSKKLF